MILSVLNDSKRNSGEVYSVIRLTFVHGHFVVVDAGSVEETPGRISGGA